MEKEVLELAIIRVFLLEKEVLELVIIKPINSLTLITPPANFHLLKKMWASCHSEYSPVIGTEIHECVY